MTLPYGLAKAKIVLAPTIRAKRIKRETQYHEHFGIGVDGATWDIAVNVGTDDADDLLRYKLVFDFHHPIVEQLRNQSAGWQDLTGQTQLPALDFKRSDILTETGDWRVSDPIDGSEEVEPVASVKRLLLSAFNQGFDVYVFGRFYSEGDGMHDIHMNQGSGPPFLHRPGDDHNDHNDIWQDGAILVDRGTQGWAAYFSMFTGQTLDTDELGNPAGS